MTRRLLPLVAALLMSGCGDLEPAAEHPVVVGAILPLSGTDAPTGERILDGLRLAADAEGTGPRLVLRVLDGGGAPITSSRRYRELSEDPEVVAIVGGWFVTTARTLAAVAAGGDGAPLVCLSPLLPDDASDPVVLPLHHATALGTASARFALEDLGAKRAALVHVPGSDVSDLLARGFRTAFEAGGAQVLWEAAAGADNALTLPVGPTAPVDVVFVSAPGEWARRCAEQTGQAAVLTVTGWSTDGLAQLADSGVPVYFTSFFSATDTSPANRRLLEAAARTGREPSPALALGWDAAMLVREAAARSGHEREAVQAAIRAGVPYAGATGRIEPHGKGVERETPAVSSLSAAGLVFLRRVECDPTAGG